MTLEQYYAKMSTTGLSKYDAIKARTKSYFDRKASDSLSHFQVLIDGVPREAMIIDTNDFLEKQIHLIHGEVLYPGSLVSWNNTMWLVTETKVNDVLYDSGKIQRCNYILKYQDKSGSLISKHCIIRDVTKYLLGE